MMVVVTDALPSSDPSQLSRQPPHLCQRISATELEVRSFAIQAMDRPLQWFGKVTDPDSFASTCARFCVANGMSALHPACNSGKMSNRVTNLIVKFESVQSESMEGHANVDPPGNLV